MSPSNTPASRIAPSAVPIVVVVILLISRDQRLLHAIGVGVVVRKVVSQTRRLGGRVEHGRARGFRPREIVVSVRLSSREGQLRGPCLLSHRQDVVSEGFLQTTKSWH